MNCQHVRERLEDYALGALDPRTRHDVEKHLARCSECRRVAEDYAAILSTLPEALGAASPLRPPPSLKDKLMQSAQASAEVYAHQLNTQHSPVPVGANGASKVKRQETARGWWHWTLNPRLWFITLTLSGASIALLLGLMFYSQMQLQEALAREQALQQEYSTYQQQQETAIQVVNSIRTQELVLHPVSPDTNAVGRIFIRPDLPIIVVTATNLEPAPKGQAYYLWVTQRGLKQLAGVMHVTSRGYGIVVFKAMRTDPIFKAAELTLQAEGSTSIGGERILAWETSPNDFYDDLAATRGDSRENSLQSTR